MGPGSFFLLFISLFYLPRGLMGKWVYIYNPNPKTLTLSEVRVYGSKDFRINIESQLVSQHLFVTDT